MSVNLSRNTKVYITTLQATSNTGETATGYTATGASTNVWAIDVLDGYSFSQSADQQTITLDEAGNVPIRGSRSFNSKLNPVEWSFSSYIRPYTSGGVVSAVEAILWNAIASNSAMIPAASYLANSSASRGATTAGATVTATTTAVHNLTVGDAVAVMGMGTGWDGEYEAVAVPSTTSVSYVATAASTATTVVASASTKIAPQAWYETAAFGRTSFVGSNKNSLQELAFIFKVDNTFYRINNASVNQAEITFDLNGIAMITWSGFGTTVKEMATTASGSLTTANPVIPAAATNYITNKLSTVVLNKNIGGGGTAYTVALTGGTITINNNIEYITPEALGVVNNPIGYYTGSRSISGSLNAYLKTGSNETASLLTQVLADSATTTEPKYYLSISIGGGTAPIRVDMLMNAVSLQIPSLDIQDVVSTTINFNAQGYLNDLSAFDIEATNDLRVSYYAA